MNCSLSKNLFPIIRRFQSSSIFNFPKKKTVALKGQQVYPSIPQIKEDTKSQNFHEFLKNAEFTNKFDFLITKFRRILFELENKRTPKKKKKELEFQLENLNKEIITIDKIDFQNFPIPFLKEKPSFVIENEINSLCDERLEDVKQFSTKFIGNFLQNINEVKKNDLKLKNIDSFLLKKISENNKFLNFQNIHFCIEFFDTNLNAIQFEPINCKNFCLIGFNSNRKKNFEESSYDITQNLFENKQIKFIKKRNLPEKAEVSFISRFELISPFMQFVLQFKNENGETIFEKKEKRCISIQVDFCAYNEIYRKFRNQNDINFKLAKSMSNFEENLKVSNIDNFLKDDSFFLPKINYI